MLGMEIDGAILNIKSVTEHIQGWVNAKYLKELDIKVNDIRYIRNFLRNFYKTQEELHFDKIKLFYSFPPR